MEGDGAFRREVRAFLERNLTLELREAAARQTGIYAAPEVAGEWHQILYARGWIAPGWPKEFGGQGWSATQRLIFETECALAGAPVLPAMGLQMCGPTLIAYGTPEQQARFLPRILSGEDYWCQGYSEPGAGSDLASLKTRAVRDGDDYIVNGSKIWTTHAHFANWIFLLVRTDATVHLQAGISFLLAPLNAAGVSVRPIRSMSGEHDVNQVFLEDVRVAVANRVGAENHGWAIAKRLLELERGGVSATARTLRVMTMIRQIAEQEQVGGRRLVDDPFFRRRLAELEIEVIATEWTQRRIAAGMANRPSPGTGAASMLKLKAAECYQRATELALDAIGPLGMIDQYRSALENAWSVGPAYAQTPVARYLNGRAMSIFGGAAEVHKDLVARTELER